MYLLIFFAARFFCQILRSAAKLAILDGLSSFEKDKATVF